MPFFVYIIYSSSHDVYYVGQTSDFPDRLIRHNRGAEKFTAPYPHIFTVFFAFVPLFTPLYKKLAG